MPLYEQSQFTPGLIVQRSTSVRPGSLTELTNAFADEDGTIRSRNGITRINAAQTSDGLGSTNIHSLHLSGDTRYLGVGTVIKRGVETANPNIVTGLTGNKVTFADAAPSPAVTGSKHVYFANGFVAARKKDNGTVTQNWGVDGPIATAASGLTFTVGTTQPATTAIDDFAATYTATDGVASNSAAATEPYATSAQAFTVPRSSIERFRRAVTVNASTQGESGFIRFMARVDNRQNLDHIEVAFDVSAGTTFSEDYYQTRITASQFTADNTWQEFKVPKNSFTRVRPTGGSVRTWANVDGVQLTVGANARGDVVVSFDDMRVEADTHPDGTYDYKFTFFNDTLKLRSNARRLQDIYTGTSALGITTEVTARRQSITFSRPAATTGAADVDPQVTHWEQWRRNVNVAGGFFFVQRTPIGTTAATDTTADIALGELLVEDNHIPPPASFVIGPYDDRLFLAGMNYRTTGSGIEEAPYGIRFSRSGNIESFPFENLILAGDPVDTCFGLTMWAGNLYSFTKRSVYQIIGTQGSYVAKTTEAPIGTLAPYSISPSPRGIFYKATDGIYLFTGGTAVNISENVLDPIFRRETLILDGLTVNPIDADTLTEADSIVGAYANGIYRFTYTELNSGSRATLCYDVEKQRWWKAQNVTAGSGWAIQRLVWEKAGISSPVDNLEAGTSDGWVVLIDSAAQTGVTDGGSIAIPLAIQTKAFDAELKDPGLEADIKDVVLDIDTGNQLLTVQASINGGNYVALGTVTTVVRDRVVFPVGTPAGTGTICYRIAIRITGNLLARMSLYGIGLQYLVEPKRVVDFSTEYNFEGHPGEKILQELQIEADTNPDGSGATAVTVTVQADGTDIAQMFTLSCNGRRTQVFSFNLPHPRATTLRIEYNNTTNAEWKLYGHQFQFIREPLTISRLETEKTDSGFPGEKLYKNLELEIDPLGTLVVVEVFIDEVSIGSFTTPSDTGRRIYYFSLAAVANLERRGRISKIHLSSGATFRYYTHQFDQEREPIRNTFFKTPITNDGHPGEKLYRTLALDIDTFGVDATVTLYIDGVAQAPSPGSTNVINNSGRRIRYISYPNHRGRFSSITISTATTQFSYYSHTFDIEREPVVSTRYVTQLSDTGHPGEKLYKNLILEIDPIGTVAVTTVFIDGVSIGAFSTDTTSGRRIYYFSLAALATLERRGRLVQIDITSAATFRYYTHQFDVEREPVRNTFHKTPISNDDHPGEKLYRTLALDIDTFGVDATVTLYLDGTAQAPSPGSTNVINNNGRRLQYISYPSHRGRFSSITISTVTTQFSYYGHTFDLDREPVVSTRYVTQLSDDGHPGEKIYKNLILDIDPIGTVATTTILIDGVSIGTLNTDATNGRRVYYFSLANNAALERRGRLVRIDITSAGTFRFYSHRFEVEREPVRNVFWKTEIGEAGHPGEKRFRTMKIDINTYGGLVTATPYIDGAAVTGLIGETFVTATRQVVHISLPDARGRNISLVLQTGSGTQFGFYGVEYDYEKEPLTSTFYFTQWSDDGWQGEKRYRTLVLDIDTAGQDVIVTPFIDGAPILIHQTNTVNTSGRRHVHLSFTTEPLTSVRGRLSAIAIAATTTTRFRYYSHFFDIEKEPISSTYYFTQWGNEGWPGEKIFRQLTLDIDTQGTAIDLDVQVDGAGQFITSVTAPSRRSLIVSLVNPTTGRPPEGRLIRIALGANSTTRFYYYGVSYEFEQQPLDVTFLDTTEEAVFGGKTGWVRRSVFIYAATDVVTGIVYANSAEVHRFTIPAQTRQSVVRVSMPVGITGEILRMTLSSPGTFKMWPESYAEVHSYDQDKIFDPWRFAA